MDRVPQGQPYKSVKNESFSKLKFKGEGGGGGFGCREKCLYWQNSSNVQISANWVPLDFSCDLNNNKDLMQQKDQNHKLKQ